MVQAALFVLVPVCLESIFFAICRSDNFVHSLHGPDRAYHMVDKYDVPLFIKKTFKGACGMVAWAAIGWHASRGGVGPRAQCGQRNLAAGITLNIHEE
jgi:hypothetical protein